VTVDVSRLCLGSAQFGLDYGISNQSGQSDPDQVSEILTAATDCGIYFIDTAREYGNSENVLGELLKSDISIVTKATVPSPDTSENPELYFACELECSLKALEKESIYGWLAHNANVLIESERMADSWARASKAAKQNGLIKKAGVSVYTPEEAISLMDRLPLDLIQIPFSPVDNRWEDALDKLHEREVEIHARSIFLQGLLLMKEIDRHPYFNPWSDVLQTWDHAANGDPLKLALTCALSEQRISKVIVGVTNKTELTGILQSLNSEPTDIPDIKKSNDPALLDPSNWKLA
jgi:aryl-alcohol dehydrogenase-like predicted oxidoreductase